MSRRSSILVPPALYATPWRDRPGLASSVLWVFVVWWLVALGREHRPTRAVTSWLCAARRKRAAQSDRSHDHLGGRGADGQAPGAHVDEGYEVNVTVWSTCAIRTSTTRIRAKSASSCSRSHPASRHRQGSRQPSPY